MISCFLTYISILLINLVTVEILKGLKFDEIYIGIKLQLVITFVMVVVLKISGSYFFALIMLYISFIFCRNKYLYIDIRNTKMISLLYIVFFIQYSIHIMNSFLLQSFGILPEDNRLLQIVMNLLIYCVIYIVLETFICVFENNSKFSNLIILLITCLPFIIILLLLYKNKNYTRISSLRLSFIFIIFIYIYILTIIISFVLMTQMKREYSLKFNNYRTQMELDKYKDLKEHQETLIETRHDFKNMILGILSLDDRNMRKELEGIYQDIDKSKSYIYSKNLIVDFILKNKLKTIQIPKKNLDIRVIMKEEIPINEVELSVILGNLLDNSISELKKQKYLSRYLRLYIEEKPNSLLLTIQNTITKESKDLNKEKSLFHGVGLKSVRKIVKRNNGVMKITNNYECFKVNISFVLPKK